MSTTSIEWTIQTSPTSSSKPTKLAKKMSAGNTEPFVSVIIPTYNEAENIGATLNSLRNQEYDNVQFVVVDDGSKDESVPVVKDQLAAIEGDHVLLENATNAGQSFSRNRGAMHANGEYVVFHDADDLSTPGRLAKQVEFLEEHPAVGVVGGGYFYVNPNRNQQEVKIRPTDDESIRRGMARECMINLGTAMFRREALMGTNLFESNNVEGYELIVNVGMDWEFANLSEPIYLYRINEGSRSQQDQLRKKMIIAFRSFQAIQKLGLPYRYLPLQLGWFVYMNVPEGIQKGIRRLFSPTEERPPSEDEKQTLERLRQYG